MGCMYMYRTSEVLCTVSTVPYVLYHTARTNTVPYLSVCAGQYTSYVVWYQFKYKYRSQGTIIRRTTRTTKITTIPPPPLLGGRMICTTMTKTTFFPYLNFHTLRSSPLRSSPFLSLLNSSTITMQLRVQSPLSVIFPCSPSLTE